MNEVEAVPVDGMFLMADEGGVCIRFSRRVLVGVEPNPENPGVATTKMGMRIVAEVWMTKETAFVLRKTLNEVLSGKPLPVPSAKKPPNDVNVG